MMSGEYKRAFYLTFKKNLTCIQLGLRGWVFFQVHILMLEGSVGFRMSQEVGEPSGSSMVEKAIHITKVTDKESVLKVFELGS